MLRQLFKHFGRGRKLAKFLYPLYLSSEKTVISNVGNVPYSFLRDDFALFFFLHDRDIVDVFQKHIKEGDHILDIGAHQGYFSAVFANKTGSSGRVYSIEAMPETYEVLVRNAELAKSHGYQIYPYNFAISNQEALLDFYSQGLSPVNSLFESWPEDPNSNFPRKKITVQAITLDAFIQLNNINRVDCIKIDIEGAEWGALLGAKLLLSCIKPRLIAIETGNEGLRFYHKNIDDLIDLMKEFNYHLKQVNKSQTNSPLNGNQGNYFFFHQTYLSLDY